MDYFLKKEIDGLKQDIVSKDIAIEADKYAYETMLLNGLGEEMLKELKTPSKPNWITGLKYKIARWWKIRSENKKFKKILKDI